MYLILTQDYNITPLISPRFYFIMANIHEDVQDYYGQQLHQSSDLKTDACCSKAGIPSFIKDIVKNVHPDVVSR